MVVDRGDRSSSATVQLSNQRPVLGSRPCCHVRRRTVDHSLTCRVMLFPDNQVGVGGEGSQVEVGRRQNPQMKKVLKMDDGAGGDVDESRVKRERWGAGTLVLRLARASIELVSVLVGCVLAAGCVELVCARRHSLQTMGRPAPNRRGRNGPRSFGASLHFLPLHHHPSAA